MCPESQISFEGPGVEHNASLKLKLQELQSQVDRLTSRRVLELPTDLGIYESWLRFLVPTPVQTCPDRDHALTLELPPVIGEMHAPLLRRAVSTACPS